MTGASATLRTVDGWCPAQRISDRSAGRVTDTASPSVIRETGRAECARCHQVVGVTRRWDDGRWGWSPWRYDPHKAVTDRSIGATAAHPTTNHDDKEG